MKIMIHSVLDREVEPLMNSVQVEASPGNGASTFTAVKKLLLGK